MSPLPDASPPSDEGSLPRRPAPSPGEAPPPPAPSPGKAPPPPAPLLHEGTPGLPAARGALAGPLRDASDDRLEAFAMMLVGRAIENGAFGRLVELIEGAPVELEGAVALAVARALPKVLPRDRGSARALATALILRSGVEPASLLAAVAPEQARYLAASLWLDGAERSGPAAIGAEQAATAVLRSALGASPSRRQTLAPFVEHVLLGAHPGRRALRDVAMIAHAHVASPEDAEAELHRIRQLLGSAGGEATFGVRGAPVAAKAALLEAMRGDAELARVVAEAEGPAWDAPAVGAFFAEALPPPRSIEAPLAGSEPAAAVRFVLGLDEAAFERIATVLPPRGEDQAPASVRVLPCVFSGALGGPMATQLVEVEVDGQRLFFDTRGARYASLDEFFAENDLPPGQVGLRERADAPVRVVPSPKTVDTAGERLEQVGDVAFGVGGLVVGGIALVTPVGWAGVAVSASGALWFGARGALELRARSERGLSLGLDDPAARRAWLDLAGATLAGVGAALRAGSSAARLGRAATLGARGADLAGGVVGAADLVDQGQAVLEGWDHLTLDERVGLLGQLAFSGALTVVPLGPKVRRIADLRALAASERGRGFVAAALRKLGRGALLEHPLSQRIEGPWQRLGARRRIARDLRLRPGERRAEAFARVGRQRGATDLVHGEAAFDLATATHITDLALKGRLRPPASYEAEVTISTALAEHRLALAGAQTTRSRGTTNPADAIQELRTRLAQDHGLSEAELQRITTLVREESVRGAVEQLLLQETLKRERRPRLETIVDAVAERAGMPEPERRALARRVDTRFAAHAAQADLLQWAARVSDHRRWPAEQQIENASGAATAYKLLIAGRALASLSPSSVRSLGSLSWGTLYALEHVPGFPDYIRSHPSEARLVSEVFEKNRGELLAHPAAKSRRPADVFRAAETFLPMSRPAARLGDFHLRYRSPRSDPRWVPEITLHLDPALEHKRAFSLSAPAQDHLGARPLGRYAHRAPPLAALEGGARTSYDGVILVRTHGGSDGRYSGAQNPAELAEITADALARAASEGRQIDTVVLEACHQWTELPGGDRPAELFSRALGPALTARGLHPSLTVLTPKKSGIIYLPPSRGPQNYTFGDHRTPVEWEPVIDPDELVTMEIPALDRADTLLIPIPPALRQPGAPAEERAALALLASLLPPGSRRETIAGALAGSVSAAGLLWLLHSAQPESASSEPEDAPPLN